MRAKTLSVDLIEVDPEVQNRKKLDDFTVEAYAAEIAAAHPEWPFPPLDVFILNDGPHVCSSGFHRLEAAKQANRGSVPCNIHIGSREDAKIFGMTANDRNGLRMTREEKRDCVEWLLYNRKQISQKLIAEMAGVCKRTVQMIVADKKAQFAPPGTKTTPAKSPKSGTNDTQTAQSDEPDLESDEIQFDDDEPKTKRKPKPKPKTTLSRADYYRQYDQAIGPLVRLIDSIADGVGELHSTNHKKTKGHLKKVTDAMMEWMGVER